MHLRKVMTLVILSIISGSAPTKGFAQNARPPRDFDAEIEAALTIAQDCGRLRIPRHTEPDLPASGERRCEHERQPAPLRQRPRHHSPA